MPSLSLAPIPRNVRKSRPPRPRIKYKKRQKGAHERLLDENRHLYPELLKLQGGVCALCGRPPKLRKLDLDHDHKSMKIRGLLCHRCNRNLPSWVTPQWLENAIIYITTRI